tara:strand:- start:21 stop:317 length:297 start_codon:yes stop_codon:yes gene_type:complete
LLLSSSEFGDGAELMIEFLTFLKLEAYWLDPKVTELQVFGWTLFSIAVIIIFISTFIEFIMKIFFDKKPKDERVMRVIWVATSFFWTGSAIAYINLPI